CWRFAQRPRRQKAAQHLNGVLDDLLGARHERPLVEDDEDPARANHRRLNGMGAAAAHDANRARRQQLLVPVAPLATQAIEPRERRPERAGGALARRLQQTALAVDDTGGRRLEAVLHGDEESLDLGVHEREWYRKAWRPNRTCASGQFGR